MATKTTPKNSKAKIKQTEADVLAAPKFTPRATEKTYAEQTKRTYVFAVDRSASKQAIAQQIASDYNVTVTSVRTLIRKGKPTRFSRGKRAYPGTTHRQNKKLAYVTLAVGNSIRVFEEDSPAAEPKATTKVSKTANGKAKTADKRTEKENK